MSWMKKLADTYDLCAPREGTREAIRGAIAEKKVPLLRPYHTTQKASMEIILNEQGELLDFNVFGAQTTAVIPCTESSAGRTSGPCPHPLADQLVYLADLPASVGKGKKAAAEEQGEQTSMEGIAPDQGKTPPKDKHALYIEQLAAWAQSSFAVPAVRAVYDYISRETLYDDLAGRQLWPVIEKVGGEKALALFVVDGVELQYDEAVWDSWIGFYQSTRPKKDVCYISGQTETVADMHPKFIRYPGDKGKLISANDRTNFTYRGMFESPEQSCNVGAETSQKAHQALKWLISRQGFRLGDEVFVAWTGPDAAIVPPFDTGVDQAKSLRKFMQGREDGYLERDEVVLLSISSTTASDGRLSVNYYRTFARNDYIDRVRFWYDTAAFPMGEFENGKFRMVTRAPTLHQIIRAAYGRVDNDSKLMAKAYERLLPCLFDRAPVPYDMVKQTVARACNRHAFDSRGAWRTALSVASAVYRKNHNQQKNEEEITMALDTSRTTRDYILGRFLAVADTVEAYGLYLKELDRPTAVERQFNMFISQPSTIIMEITKAISPYLNDSPYKRMYKKLLAEVMAPLEVKDLQDKTPLSGEFLLGYLQQYDALNNKKQAEEEPAEEE